MNAGGRRETDRQGQRALPGGGAVTGKILVLGATGTLGTPVVHALVEGGHTVRVLAREPERARRILGADVEVFEGSVFDRRRLVRATAGCEAVHVSLPSDSELVAMEGLLELSGALNIHRISYVSGTSACQENRWFDVIETKMRAEDLLRRSGVPYIIFRPTWVMESLHKFVRGDKAAVISGTDPPPLHFLAASDLGSMVSAAYDDDRALGKELYVHGPEAVPLPNAVEALLRARYPDVKVVRLKLWQASLLSRFTGRMGPVTRLIRFFHRVGELGDPSEANRLFGAPTNTLNQWIEANAASHP